MECGSCGFALLGAQDSPGPEGDWSLASIAEQYRRQAGVAGRGKAWPVPALLDPSAFAL